MEPSLITAYLLLTRPEIQQVYDEDTQEVTKEEIQTVEMIPFRVDTKYGILEVFANKDSVSNVTNKIGQVTSWETTIENTSFSPQQVLSTIESRYRVELNSIKISDYPITDSAVGSFQIDIDDQNLGRDLLNKHSGDISYLGASVKTDGESVTIGIYNSGSIIVYNNIDNMATVLDVIKEGVVGGGEEVNYA
ncbi:hypothetical protein BB347_16945 (plasmid) [Natronorubrum daqingense]|uniref:Uncharacterized protein n=1 Tax=Natronorubrum daqingense TaxID=588898 RepID=A0A1P8RIJ7_9EURY|nr:hypothetical protein BB347_16945 [Natronorubrum daqingense]